jgi:hypothetical protein
MYFLLAAKRVFLGFTFCVAGSFRPVRFIEIDLDKPDFQSLRAAQELIDDDHSILFPGETGILLLMRFSITKAERLRVQFARAEQNTATLFVAEDFDIAESQNYPMPVQMADAAKNRAFHTLVQLCDAPLIGYLTEDTREEAAIAHPEIEYAFWPIT